MCLSYGSHGYYYPQSRCHVVMSTELCIYFDSVEANSSLVVHVFTLTPKPTLFSPILGIMI